MSKLLAAYDLTVIGGGIIGLATARQLALSHPKLKVCVLEKENELASHQSKRNSGVVHCGVYYKRRSMKSKFCIKGAQLIEKYCQEKQLPYLKCGKLIVATREEELETLHNLFENATANKIKGIELFNRDQVLRVQPMCTNSLEAIWSANTACVDWQQIAHSFAKDFETNNGHILSNFTVYKLLPANKGLLHVFDAKTENYIETRAIVNCSGLFSDYFARSTGNNPYPNVIPFKGTYYNLCDEVAKSIKTNIYPVPDPKFPFLGVHITPRVDGSILLGPTAKLVLNYERYTESDDIRLTHMYHILFKTGLRNMISWDFISAGLKEAQKSGSKKMFAEELAHLLPGINQDDLIETKFCGIRAQAVNRDGTMVDDFLFETGVLPQFNRVLHVRNCPSPAATSSLAIAERLVNILEERILA